MFEESEGLGYPGTLLLCNCVTDLIMKAFVIQQHDHPDGTHWDLMLEEAGHLATWQVPLPPDKWSATPIACTRIFDHSKKYLTYEGPIFQNRGSVTIAASGTYQTITQTDTLWSLTLSCPTLSGTLTLSHTSSTHWHLILTPG